MTEPPTLELVALPAAVPGIRRTVREHLGAPCPEVRLRVSKLLTSVIKHVATRPAEVCCCSKRSSAAGACGRQRPAGHCGAKSRNSHPETLQVPHFAHRYQSGPRYAAYGGRRAETGGVTMGRTLALKCVATLVIGAAATGCGAAATAESPGISASRRAGESRELSDAEQILVQRAEQELVKECMEDAGFTYWVGPLPTVDELKGGGYVLTDPDWAKRHGYGSRLQQKLQDNQRNDPNHAYANALPQEEGVRYDKALAGRPSDGMLTAELPGGGTVRTPAESCQVDAKEQLYGDFETWFRAEKTATNLNSLYVPALLKDERFTSALTEWATCMREAGHSYADPPEIRAKLPGLTEGLSPEKAYATEVDLAVAEATCAVETNLADTAHELESEYREKELKGYGEEVAAYERMSLAALARAEEITGSTA